MILISSSKSLAAQSAVVICIFYIVRNIFSPMLTGLWNQSKLTLSIEAIIPEMQKGDILGHEFCGVVETVGPSATRYKTGDRVVASFQIACGQCYYCKQKLSSVCEQTNANELSRKLYGRRTAGMI